MGKTKDERLRYQLKIKPSGSYEKKEPHKLFFGNQGCDVKKQTLFHSQGVELTINTYFNDRLLNKIKENLPICLALENFGTRQNKGFRCFYLDGKEEDIPTVLKKFGKPVYFFDTRDGNSFDYIDVLYKAMKSGINETFRNPNAYLKSMLWQYFNESRPQNQRITWEKRFMKQALSGSIIPDSQYFKALLGVCEEYPFRRTTRDAKMDNEYGDTGTFYLKNNATFKISHSDIARFKSPITFKPIGKRVYIVLNEDTYVSEGIRLQGASFRFECGNKKGNLKVPVNFSLKDFMDFVMKNVNKGFGGFKGKSADILRKIKIQKLSDEGVQK